MQKKNKNILWVTATPFAKHFEMLDVKSSPSHSGSWLSAAYDSIKQNSPSLSLTILTVYDVKYTMKAEFDGVTFYILPSFKKTDYVYEDIQVRATWEKLKETCIPDCIQIWGTESKYALAAAKAFSHIPILIYMQGVINSVQKHYYDGLPNKYKTYTFRDLYNQHNYKRQTKIETEVLSLAYGVIVENDWCADQCLAINHNLKIFKNNIPIKEIFYKSHWRANTNSHNILTNAGGYPIKGHHILFEALSIVKKQIPDIKLLIPGIPLQSFSSIKRKTGYSEYLSLLIKKNKLHDNIEYIGTISAEEMASQLEECRLYVMPSIVENHSCSLIEALLVGVPCVTSLVGGIAELVTHKENALLYNSLDAVSLAGNIIRLFDDKDLSMKLSSNAKLKKKQRNTNFASELLKIYEIVLQANLYSGL